MKKSIIKHNIKKLSFIEETIRLRPNLDFASLYGNIMGYNNGELGIIMAPPGYGKTTLSGLYGSFTEDNFNYSSEHMLYDDSQSDELW